MTSSTEPQSTISTSEQSVDVSSTQQATPLQSRKCWVCGYVNTPPYDWDGACKKCYVALP